jgi:phthalate 4,5-cis-dihydrodiol dehydrogenase
MPDAIRLGVSGLGSAATFMIHAAKNDPRIVLAAAYDPLPHPRMAFTKDFKATVYDSFSGLCSNPDIDAIYIAAPHEFHAEQAAAALRCGKHVVVEKPLALTLAGCDEIIEAAKAAQRHVIVGHTHAFDPGIVEIQKRATSGEFGRLAMILSFNYTDFLYRPRRPEELVTARGGGIAFNQISHQIDMAKAVAASPVRSVRANFGANDPKRPTEGNSTLFLEFANGAAASLVYSSYDFFDSDELHGWISEIGFPKQAYANGRARQTLSSTATPEVQRRQGLGYGSRSFPSAEQQLPHFGFFLATFDKADVRVTPDGLAVFSIEGMSTIPLPKRPSMGGHMNVLDSLWKACRLGQPCLHDAHWGRDTLEVVLAALTSARDRREVFLATQ